MTATSLFIDKSLLPSHLQDVDYLLFKISVLLENIPGHRVDNKACYTPFLTRRALV